MTKKTLQQEYSYACKPNRFTRPPIHPTSENEEEITEDEEEEEEEENYSNTHQRKTLYPSLTEDLRKLRRITKSKDSQLTHKYGTTEPKGENREKAKKLVMSGKTDSDTRNFNLIIYLLVLIVVAICLLVYKTQKETSDIINVKELVENMQIRFQKQQPYTFKVLNLALTKVVNDNPKPLAPAIFTIIANKGAEKTASDFSIHLAKALAPGNFVLINDSLQWSNNPEQLKFNIDNKIKSKLEKEILNVVIVDRLNDIPIEAALIFHGFCDHENAPYKQAVYLFIVHLSRIIPMNSTVRDIEKVAWESLRHIWRTSTEDVVDSLMTRLTVNVLSII